MASLVSGIYDLAEQDPAKTQEGELSSLGGFETGTGEGLTTAGANFDESILSGDPTRIAQTLAPEISSGQTQVQQQANQNAQFGTRSGGSTASTNAAQAGERANIINLEGGLQSGTAGSALSAGSNLLGQASSNIDDVAKMKIARQATRTADVGGIAQGAAGIASGFAGGASPESVDPASFSDLIQQGTVKPEELDTSDAYFGEDLQP